MKKIKEIIQSKNTTIVLANIGLMLVILFMLAQTNNVWSSIFKRAFNIVLPFIVGFIIAYFLAPLTNRLQKIGLNKSLSILATCFIVIGFFVFLLIFVSPQIYRLANDFYTEYKNEFDFGIIDFVDQTFGFDLTPIYDYVINYLGELFTDFRNYIELNLPSIITKTISITVTTIFGIAVALYALADDGKIRGGFFNFAAKIHKDAEIYINTVDKDLRLYFRGMFLVCLERTIEYAIVYLVLGSEHFLILGLIHGIGVFIPYIGGMFGSLIGVISLMLAHQGNWPLILFCFIVLVVLQYVDEYYIAPKILSKSTKINPLWIIFAVFTGGSLLGIVGIIIAIPTFIAFSVSFKTYARLKKAAKEKKTE